MSFENKMMSSHNGDWDGRDDKNKGKHERKCHQPEMKVFSYKEQSIPCRKECRCECEWKCERKCEEYRDWGCGEDGHKGNKNKDDSCEYHFKSNKRCCK